MLGNYVGKFVENRKKRKIAAMVREGTHPRGVSKEYIWECLKYTRPKNTVEMFGFLEAQVHNPDGTLKMDCGLQSVKKVTAVFCKKLVDGMIASGTALEDFKFHKMGSASAAEASGDTALGAVANVYGSGVQTHGASSLIYSCSAIMTAISSLDVREHGLFNATTGGQLLDKSSPLAATISLVTDDTVTWTYTLTVNTET